MALHREALPSAQLGVGSQTSAPQPQASMGLGLIALLYDSTNWKGLWRERRDKQALGDAR